MKQSILSFVSVKSLTAIVHATGKTIRMKRTIRPRDCPKCHKETNLFLAECYWCVECDVLFRAPVENIYDRKGRI